MAISLQSYNEILGKLIHHLIANGTVNDLNPGSVLLTLLEAIASNDFDNNMAILSVLETLTLDALKNNDLDKRAADYGLSRFVAQVATGFVDIGDKSIKKQSTTLYNLKLPPVAGNTVIYVTNTEGWKKTGELYIGRGTQRFEGPIPYNLIKDEGSFFSIRLTRAIEKDHLISDVVVNSQNTPDRYVPAGTLVIIPANNQRPEIQYRTTQDCILAAGEDIVKNIPIVSLVSGSNNNAGIGTIVKFSTDPFEDATVVNTGSLIDATDIESDESLRARIKNYSTTLARGTREAILSSIIGLSNPKDGKQVASAQLVEPPKVGDPSIVYIDDGSGLQPSFTGQSVDILINSAIGEEEFVQLANFPLTRPQAINQEDGPLTLVSGSVFSVVVDGVEDTIEFSSNRFRNINSATYPEIVAAMNDQAILFRARLTNNGSRILIYPIRHDAEQMQVLPTQSNDALKFPTTSYSYITLYRNNELLKERSASATISTKPFNEWNFGPTDNTGTLIIEVDGTPPQTISFGPLDFGNLPIQTAVLVDWVEVFNKKIAGITAIATSSSSMQIQSNRIGQDSKLEVVGGTFMTNMFDLTKKSAVGQSSDFKLNRQTGNLQLLFKLSVGDSITAGSEDTKGEIISAKTNDGKYNLTTDDSSRYTEIYISADDKDAKIRQFNMSSGSSFTITKKSDSLMTLTVNNSPSLFINVQIGDYIYIANRGLTNPFWFKPKNCGIFRVISKTTSSLDLYNADSVDNDGPYIVSDIVDIKAFSSKTYVQRYRTDGNPPIQDLNTDINAKLLNIASTIFKTSQIKLTSTTEEGGSVALLTSAARFAPVFAQTPTAKEGNQSHIANRKTDKDVVGHIRFEDPEHGWLNRYRYGRKELVLTDESEPNTGSEDFGEELTPVPLNNIRYQDILVCRDGANKDHYLTIREFPSVPGDTVRTQKNKPYTLFDYSTGDSLDMFDPLSVSSTDNIVFLIDDDIVNKVVSINMWRTGQINSLEAPTTTSFSANDFDNEIGITFSTPSVWSKDAPLNTEFKDYALYFRARNWYKTGGANAVEAATMIVRAKEYGPNGEKLKFSIQYPSAPNRAPEIRYLNTIEDTTTILVMGSGDPRTTSIHNGSKFTVEATPVDGVYKYIFEDVIDEVSVGDVMSISAESKVSSAHIGSFSVRSIDADNKTVEVYNPNGTETDVGTKQKITITTVEDFVGTPDEYTLQTSAASSISPGDYFTISDGTNIVGFWYEIDSVGSEPTDPSVAVWYKIATQAIQPANTVAAQTFAQISSVTTLTATAINDVISITRNINGNYGDIFLSAGIASDFTETKTPIGTPDIPLDGQYIRVFDKNGSTDIVLKTTTGYAPSTSPSRVKLINTIGSGDSANTIATKIAAAFIGDQYLTASATTNTVVIDDLFAGIRIAPINETDDFTVVHQNATSNEQKETIQDQKGVTFFPLDKNGAKDICESISLSDTLIATPVGDDSLPILLSTAHDIYTHTGNNSALAYNHTPEEATISLFDSTFYIKIFANSTEDVPAPNFILKSDMLLQGVVPSIYSVNTCPNVDTPLSNGELFKLCPSNILNIYHHLTHKALSQLPIVANIDIVDNYRKIQVKSKELGSKGSVEIIGGRANTGDFLLSGSEGLGIKEQNRLQVPISAYPSTLIVDNVIKINNKKPAKRQSVYNGGDTFKVVSTPKTGYFKIVTNPKDIGNIAGTTWTISDVSDDYGLSAGAGIVWKYKCNNFVDLNFTSIKPGDKLFVRNNADLGAGNNYVLKHNPSSGVGEVPGYTILGVIGGSVRELDVVNTLGSAVTNQPLTPSTGLFQVFPSPINEWEIKHSSVDTKYKIQSLGFNNLFALTCVDGTPPQFTDCGVCVDDFMIISGNTFDVANRGRFRVICITNDYVVFENPTGINQEHTIKNFKNGPISTPPQWQTNATIVAGINGSFENVNDGDWVKKYTDPEDMYVQVDQKVTTDPDLDVLILKSQYSGSNELAVGVAFDQANTYGGMPLLDTKDIRFFEGDSVVVGDKVVIANSTKASWFKTANSGTFEVLEYGLNVNDDYRPYIEIFNLGGLVQPPTIPPVSPETFIQYSQVTDGYYFLESKDNLYQSYRTIKHAAINRQELDVRFLYLYPDDREYKVNKIYDTTISSLSKIGFGSGPVVGLDGYLFYTGILSDVQKTIDGYDPDPINFPGMRAVGSAVEVLPPLIKAISISINVVTKNGFNLADIGNDIKSAVINHINTLGVGGDVILSSIIALIMDIEGVASVTFADPTPNTERIPVAFDQKAYIEPDAIRIS